MVLEHWVAQMPGQFDFNELRQQLGLPTLGPIDPKQQPVMAIPLVRLARLHAAALSDEELRTAFYRAGAFGIRPALRKFAEAIIARPGLAGSDHQQHAYATLVRIEEDVARALELINQGRRAAEAKKRSCASWDLMELSLRFVRHEGPEAMRLIEHLQQRHLEEPGVGEALTHMLIDVGLLNPDGTPAIGPEAAAEPGMAAEEQAAPEPGKLWTPDSAEPGRGGGKLWTPG